MIDTRVEPGTGTLDPIRNQIGHLRAGTKRQE